MLQGRLACRLETHSYVRCCVQVGGIRRRSILIARGRP